MPIQLNGEYVDMGLALTRNTPQDQQLPQHYEAFDDYIFLLTFIIIFFSLFFFQHMVPLVTVRWAKMDLVWIHG